MRMIRAAASLFLLLLTGCASVPHWSDNPADCAYETGRFDEGFGKDIVTGVAKMATRNYICVESAKPVRLPSFIQLLELPPAERMPVVAVYKFQDLTGQRKARPGIADFSTAVTQGNAEVLIDALKTAGNGTWFRVAERQGLDHLIRERQLIRTGREEYAKISKTEPVQLQSLLFAGMILEGGVIGYDSNLKTGGIGARYLGIGVSKQYRQDQVTVSLRAVSTLTGEVLLNVQTTKTILSYGSNGDIFRFIEEGTELVEYENGTGNNESVTYAVRTAVEAAVLEMVYQGHERDLWKIKGRE